MIPIVAAWRIGRGQLAVLCPFCGGVHYHGGGPRKGEGDGPRLAHCQAGSADSYDVREVSTVNGRPIHAYPLREPGPVDARGRRILAGLAPAPTKPDLHPHGPLSGRVYEAAAPSGTPIAICTRVAGHEGSHVSVNGVTW